MVAGVARLPHAHTHVCSAHGGSKVTTHSNTVAIVESSLLYIKHFFCNTVTLPDVDEAASPQMVYIMLNIPQIILHLDIYLAFNKNDSLSDTPAAQHSNHSSAADTETRHTTHTVMSEYTAAGIIRSSAEISALLSATPGGPPRHLAPHVCIPQHPCSVALIPINCSCIYLFFFFLLFFPGAFNI